MQLIKEDLEDLTIEDFEVYIAPLTEEEILNQLRAKREIVFTAFDTYKENVNYGIIEETEETKMRIIAWYKECLELIEEAIDNPPEEIVQYMGGASYEQ